VGAVDEVRERIGIIGRFSLAEVRDVTCENGRETSMGVGWNGGGNAVPRFGCSAGTEGDGLAAGLALGQAVVVSEEEDRLANGPEAGSKRGN
jgi:hypothetical protein